MDSKLGTVPLVFYCCNLLACLNKMGNASLSRHKEGSKNGRDDLEFK